MYNAYTVYTATQTLRIMHACMFHDIYVLLTTVNFLAISNSTVLCSMCSGTAFETFQTRAYSQGLENTV